VEAMSMKVTLRRTIKPGKGISAAAICFDAHFTLHQAAFLKIKLLEKLSTNQLTSVSSPYLAPAKDVRTTDYLFP
jgi:hypothetical protein